MFLGHVGPFEVSARSTAGRQFVREGIGEQVVGGVRQGHGLGGVVEQDLPVAAVGCVPGDGFDTGRQARHVRFDAGLLQQAADQGGVVGVVQAGGEIPALSGTGAVPGEGGAAALTKLLRFNS
ncbi:hypothetical protein [Streptomyces pseudoechinosporeus]